MVVGDTPPETRRLGHADLTTSPELLDAFAAIIHQHGSLYAWAADQPQPRAMRGRAPVYVATLASADLTVVVRHAWHGGLLAPISGDRFRRPTRAPLELEMSRRLRAAGIPTTDVLGFARYDAGFGLCRVDVLSRFINEAYDLGVIAAGLVPDMRCDEALAATLVLLQQLAGAGVHHPDLNVKNILLVRDDDQRLTAHIIDVDVVRWNPSRPYAETMRANVDRLARSMRKWRTHFGCEVSDAVLAQFSRDSLTHNR
jgi:3-deoxy-D-manno-octulosonic acid kinase